MGCWNETCAITQMPIQNGDPVVLVFLTKVDQTDQNHDGFCYSNAIWAPKFLPVFGSYDDYGGIEDVQENWNTQHIVQQLAEELAQVRLTRPSRQVDSDDLHDVDKTEQLDLSNFCIQDVMEQIHEDRIWVPGVRGLLPMGWCMMHRWVWDHMTRIMERDWRDNLTLDQVVQHGETYYEAMLHKHAEVRAIEDETKTAMGLLLKYSRRGMVEWDNTFSIMCESPHQLDGYYTRSGVRDYDDVLWQLAEQEIPVQDAQVQEVIHLLSEYLIFVNNMSVLRKFWSPQTGKGSQISLHKAHLALHELCVNKIKEVMKEHDEEDT